MYKHLNKIAVIALFWLVIGLPMPVVAVNQTVGNWTFNQSSGNYANDSSTYKNNGTIYDITTGRAAWATNLVNGSVNSTALDFGGDANVNISANASLNFTGAFSFSGWIKTTNGTSTIIAKGGAQCNYCIDLLNGYTRFFGYSGGIARGITFQAGTTVNDGAWHYITATYDETKWRIYKDGVILTSTDDAAVLTPTIESLMIASRQNTTNFTGTIDEVQLFNYTLNDSEITTIYQQFQPVPAYPVGGIVLPGTYPPLTTNVNFSWHDNEYPADRFTVAEDTAFNVIVHDAYYSTDYADIALEAGKTYYWRVRQYNGTSGTFGDTSATQTFSITATPAATDGTAGINGIIYETVSGTKTPLSDVQVFIYNNSWSNTMFTGSNGYYLFSGLNGESVYYLTAKKENYEDSAIQTVNTTSAAWVSHDIPLIKCISVYCGYYNTQYVKFTLQSVFGKKYPDVAVSVYKGDEAATTYTGVTASDDASVTFLLIKDQEYRLTFINATQGISREMTVIPYDTSYIVIVSVTNTPWQEHEDQEKDEINITVSKSTPNSTFAYINVTYIDGLNQTSALTVYINQTNASDPYNQTVIASWTATLPANNTNHSFLIGGYSGQQYLVHFVGTHDEYGTIDRTYAVIFDKSASITGIPDRVWAYIAVFLMVFVGAVFTYSTSEKGIMIVCAMGWIFMFLGWFDTLNKTQIAVALTVVSILAVMAYINRSNKAEGYA